MARILAGDLGGTKCDFAVYERDAGRWHERRSGRLASADFADPLDVLHAFLRDGDERFDAVGLAVAGPVHDRHCRFTNLPHWTLDADALAAELRAPVAMVNDFVANAHGLAELRPEDVAVLQEGVVDPDGAIGLIGAGTGLGHAVAIREPGGLRVLPSEGGQADFAPRDETEVAFWRFLRARFGAPVACERAVSGPGLGLLWRFVVEQGLAPELPATRDRIAVEDPAAVVAARALDGSDPACERALSMFLSLYGSEAGNFALHVLPTGGLYVVGGIAPRMPEAMRRGEFLEGFVGKDRSRDLLARFRVSLVIRPGLGLLGARALAARAVASGSG